jgi:MFS superfamily sulfate permease-like transporter
MIGFYGVITLISSIIFVIGFSIAMTEQWVWRSKWHERITVGCAIIAVIFSTFLNIFS